MDTLTKKTNGKASKADEKNIKQNGVSANGAKPHVNKESVASATAEVKTEQKAERKEVIAPVVEAKKVELTLEQKIEKVENLKTLIEKREKLESSRKKLQSFVIGTNNFNENIVLTDENGNSFKTSNSEVFTKVVATINETLVSKIAEIEKQIEF